MMILITLLLPLISAGSYSIHYSGREHHPSVIGQAAFSSSPSATQVADIYSRVSGQAPILNEGFNWHPPSSSLLLSLLLTAHLFLNFFLFEVESSLPSIDILEKSNSRPVILHLIGGGS